MGLAQYAIVPVQDEWGVLHDGNVNGKYATKESGVRIRGGRCLARASPGARGSCQRARPRSGRDRARKLASHTISQLRRSAIDFTRRHAKPPVREHDRCPAVGVAA